MQPPSGGCVLKHSRATNGESRDQQPPSGGCVLKQLICMDRSLFGMAAAFGRLCVETNNLSLREIFIKRSRLRAAVC